MSTCARVSSGLLFVGLLAGCATAQPKPQVASSQDDGYFLSWKQKGELIGQGCIQDDKENWYDIWMVPGYVPPMTRAGKYMGRAGDAFAEYGGAQKYHDLARRSRKAFDFAYDDCLDELIWQDMPEAWEKYWHQAERRSRKRVFGWWFAYPWATLETVVDPIVRVPLGVCGSVFGSVWGGVAVPTYYMLDSTCEGTWHFTANSLVVPTLACAWNTVVAPPMSLVGQQPAPARVDGFWVRMLSPNDYARRERMEKPVTEEELQVLVQWGKVLLKESQSFESARLQVHAECDRIAAGARATASSNVAAMAIAEKTHLREVVRSPEHEKQLMDLQAYGFDDRMIGKTAKRIQALIQDDTSLSASERARLMTLLYQYPPAGASGFAW